MVSYQVSGSGDDHDSLTVFSSQSQGFIAGGSYEMQVLVPPASPTGRTRFLVVFATGPVLQSPDYDLNLIAWAG